MKLIGEKIFAKDAEGRLMSRIGTMFFRTPGLVTKRGVHAMQRLMWIDEINAEREKEGKPPLTLAEEEAEVAESVDLIFTEDLALIRPNPDRMDLAFRADEELQKLVAKPRVRYLNTHSAKVREALRARGENWRMARQPISQDDMAHLIAKSKVPIEEAPIYYYNRITGTRFLTVSTYDEVSRMPDAAFRAQIDEIVTGLNKRNRAGYPEVDVFPPVTPIAVKRTFQSLKVAELDDAALRAACEKIALDWRMALPADLREETVVNFEWRNEMCHALTRGPNETAAEEQEIVSGISPEFYRQIEWLPGARLEGGEVIFDDLYDEAARTQDPELLALCDSRVKALIFNMTRLYGKLSYFNVGRIAHSLSRRPDAAPRRGHAYIVQVQEADMAEPRVVMIRLQKWGVAEHLDEGKDLLQSIFETEEYADYVLDRRLMCCQLGMPLPTRLGYGQFTEKYHGPNEYNGTTIRTGYFVRAYVPGLASDKVPLAKYRNPAWAQKFAFLMGEAAALDLVVGRRNSVSGELLFDFNYEVVQMGEDGLPASVCVTDHAGSFVDYMRDYADYVADYAAFAKRREEYVSDSALFAKSYVEGFRRKLAETQQAYRARRRAFDGLFVDRPYDTNGSGAYRWACALKRLDACEPDRIADLLAQAVGC